MGYKYLKIEISRFLKINLLIIIIFLFLHLISVISDYYIDEIIGFPSNRIFYLFDLDKERNFPTAYAGIMIFFSSIILFILGKISKKRKDKFKFYFLSSIFFFLGWDELFLIHETLGLPVRSALKTSGYFHHAWILPYGVIVILLAFIFARFILSFPKNIRNQIFIAGFVYIFGELILEAFSGNLVSLNWPNGRPDFWSYTIFSTLEEILGLIGILIFNFALLKLLKLNLKKKEISIILKE